jgi:hypothetical protein
MLAFVFVRHRLDDRHFHLRLVPALHIHIAMGLIDANRAAWSEIHLLRMWRLNPLLRSRLGRQERRESGKTQCDEDRRRIAGHSLHSFARETIHQCGFS